MKKQLQYSLKIIAAFVLAVIIWEVVATAFLYDQPEFVLFPKGIVAKEGSRTLNSFEGYAILKHRNEFGTYHEIRKDKPIIIYQGDSFTYARQVDADKNFVSFVARSNKDFEHVNAGNFGTHFADYYHNKQYFDKLDPVHYFIQIRYSDFEDSFAKHHLLHFISEDGKLMIEKGSNAMVNFFKEHFILYSILNKINLLHIFKEKYYGKLTNLLNIFKTKHVEENSMATKANFYIRKQLELMKTTYGDKLTLIYFPTTPTIENNELILIDSEEETVKQEIFAIASELSIDIVDVSDVFQTYYKGTKQFPSGFHNTFPGVGHLNNHGHLLVAREVIHYLEKLETVIAE